MKLQSPIRYAIFDMDGVLLDTEPIYARVIQSFVGRYGHTYDWQVKAKVMGRGTKDALRFLIETYSLPLSLPDFVAQYESVLETALAESAAMPFAEPFTRSLHDRGVPLAIATSTQERLLRVKMRRHKDWLSIFRVIVSAEHPAVVRTKPAPDAFLAAARELGADPSACVVFEDAPSGVAAALAAGMQVVAIPDAQADRSLFASAHLVISSFAECGPSDLGL